MNATANPDKLKLDERRKNFFAAITAGNPLIAILRGIPASDTSKIGSILAETAITYVEVPLTSPDALTSIRRLQSEFGQQLVVGAGTVLHPSEVDRAHQAGAQFIVSPNTDISVIEATVKLQMDSLPGVLTPSEALRAIQAGATALKLFPAQMLSVDIVKAMQTVLPSETTLIPVGGVEPRTMSAYWNIGIRIFAAGSYLYRPTYSLETITERAHALVQSIQSLRT